MITAIEAAILSGHLKDSDHCFGDTLQTVEDSIKKSAKKGWRSALIELDATSKEDAELVYNDLRKFLENLGYKVSARAVGACIDPKEIAFTVRWTGIE